MSIELKIPKVGESITEVQIAEWLKSEGDEIKKDEAMAVIDSEKTTFELPAPVGGRLAKILHQAGETVGVGTVVAMIEPGGQTVPLAKAQPVKTKDSQENAISSKPNESKKSPVTTSSPKDPAPMENKTGLRQPDASVSTYESSDMGSQRGSSKPDQQTPDNVTDEAKNGQPSETGLKIKSQTEEGDAKGKAAKTVENKLSLSGGEKPQTATPKAEKDRLPEVIADAEEEVVPLSMMRRTIARRLVEAQQTMAMLTTFNEVDMNAVQTFRREYQDEFQRRYGVKLGLMSFFVKAVIDALKQFPQLNAELRGNDLVYRNYFDIGVAVAVEAGLVVPVLHGAERLSFAEVEQAVAGFARKAKEDELKPADLEGGTFTITNGGVFGSLLSTPIINPPQTGILGLHTIGERPVARDGNVVIRPMMYMALTYDHRVVDGREAVLFLRRIRETIENPARMLLEI